MTTKRGVDPIPSQAAQDPCTEIRTRVGTCYSEAEHIAGCLSGIASWFNRFQDTLPPSDDPQDDWELCVTLEALKRYTTDLKRICNRLCAIEQNRPDPAAADQAA